MRAVSFFPSSLFSSPPLSSSLFLPPLLSCSHPSAPLVASSRLLLPPLASPRLFSPPLASSLTFWCLVSAAASAISTVAASIASDAAVLPVKFRRGKVKVRWVLGTSSSAGPARALSSHFLQVRLRAKFLKPQTAPEASRLEQYQSLFGIVRHG